MNFLFWRSTSITAAVSLASRRTISAFLCSNHFSSHHAIPSECVVSFVGAQRRGLHFSSAPLSCRATDMDRTEDDGKAPASSKDMAFEENHEESLKPPAASKDKAPEKNPKESLKKLAKIADSYFKLDPQWRKPDDIGKPPAASKDELSEEEIAESLKKKMTEIAESYFRYHPFPLGEAAEKNSYDWYAERLTSILNQYQSGWVVRRATEAEAENFALKAFNKHLQLQRELKDGPETMRPIIFD